MRSRCDGCPAKRDGRICRLFRFSLAMRQACVRSYAAHGTALQHYKRPT